MTCPICHKDDIEVLHLRDVTINYCRRCKVEWTDTRECREKEGGDI